MGLSPQNRRRTQEMWQFVWATVPQYAIESEYPASVALKAQIGPGSFLPHESAVRPQKRRIAI